VQVTSRLQQYLHVHAFHLRQLHKMVSSTGCGSCCSSGQLLLLRRVAVAAAAVLFATAAPPAAAQEVISDLVTTPADESRALEVKTEEFWGAILAAAQDMHLEEHMTLYADAERALCELPAENTYVREALVEALTRLKHADAAVLARAAQSSDLASQQLSNGQSGTLLSIFSRGGSFIEQALRRFVDGSSFSEKLVQQVVNRQAEILPLLRDTAESTGAVLTDCRLSSKRSFDLLKYDIYNKGVPTTPEAAKAVAHRIVDASAATRKRFTGFIVKAVGGITRDFLGRHDRAAATVARSELAAFAAQTTDAPIISSGIHFGSVAAPIINI